MYQFWNDVIAPVIEAAGARRIVEVGALRGENTVQMLERLGPDAELHVIDPLPEFDPREHEARFAGRYVFHRDLSVNVLGHLPPMDMALIDGDHNWYTVHTELRLLAHVSRVAGTPFPVAILHDVCWPYGRRDLYYDPATIPEEHRQPWSRAGIRRGQSELARGGGGLNAQLANAQHEGGPRNGVMTALEDFVAQHDQPLRVIVLPIYFGLAIVAEVSLLRARPALADVLDRLESPAGKDMLLRLGEDIRLDAALFEQILLRQRDGLVAGLRHRYLDTVKSAIVNDHHLETEVRLHHVLERTQRGGKANGNVMADPARHATELVRWIEEQHQPGDVPAGPGFAPGGRFGLDHLHGQLDAVWAAGVRGDVAVCGAGQGGSTLLVAAFLDAHEENPRPAHQRQLWVLDRFRRSEGGADLNLVRDRLHRFGLLGRRVRLLRGLPAATASKLADRQLALLVLGPALAADVDAVLDQLYPRLSDGGVVVVEGEPRLVDAVERYRSRRGITAPLGRDASGGLAWTRQAAPGTPAAPGVWLARAPATPRWWGGYASRGPTSPC